MAMYTILRRLDGSIRCVGELQDGRESWSEASLEAAVEAMKKFARAANGAKIGKRDILFLQEKQVSQVQWEPFKG